MSNTELSSNLPDYLETYSLSCEPFAEGIDARFFYGGTALMQRLDLLAHLTQFGESVVLVSGPKGSGKTTLLTRFVAHTSSQWRLCLINAEEFDRFTDILMETLRVAESRGDHELLAQWVSQTDGSQLLVIVIDNAEQLDEHAFDRLCTLLTQPFGDRLRLILFGTPQTQQSLKQTLERKNLSCTTQFLEVPRLSEEETASYLMYRLAVAGYSGESPFTATEVRAICKAADGRPGMINQLAHESLLEHQARAKSQRVRRVSVKRKSNSLTWGIASIAVVAVASYLGLQRLYQGSPTPDQVAPASQENELPLAIPEPQRLIPEPEPKTSVAAITQRQATRSIPASPAGESAVPSPAPRMDIVPDAGKQAQAEPPTAEPAPPEAVPPPALPEHPTTAGPDAAREIPSTEAGHPETIKEPAPATDQEPAADIPPAVASVSAERTGQPETAPAADTRAAAPAAPRQAASFPHREEWLLEQPGTSFSLQLLGSRSEKSVTDFIRQHKLDKHQTAYYRGQYKGAAWYVLMYGIYPSKQAALTGRDNLPAGLREGKPWPRSLSSVQQAIREVR